MNNCVDLKDKISIIY